MPLGFFSGVTVPVQTLSATGAALSQATGFLYKRDKTTAYFVTNWHVVTGRDPTSPKSTTTGAVPVALRLILHRYIGPKAIRLSQQYELCLRINNEEGSDPAWLEHPQYGYQVDMVALRITHSELESKAQYNFLLEYTPFEPRLKVEAMDDVFIIGYPWGLTGGGPMLPLYKRGTVASEPIVDYGGLPRFLVDCRTASGMSGSPVVVARRGIWSPDGKLNAETVIGTVENFAGVYSGRLFASSQTTGEDAETSEIGLVWKKQTLDEIVAAGALGAKLSDL